MHCKINKKVIKPRGCLLVYIFAAMDMVTAIGEHLRKNCDFDNSYFHYALGLTHFVPIFITFIFFGISYYSGEIYFLILSFALALDYALNFILAGVLAEGAPNPLCGGTHANPSFHTEHAFFFYTYLLLSRFFFNLQMNWRDVVLLQLWVQLTWVSSVTLGYNSFEQALGGAYVGSVAAFVVQFIIYSVWRRVEPWLMTHPVVTRAGYSNTIIRVDEAEMQLLVHRVVELQNAEPFRTGSEARIRKQIWDEFSRPEAIKK